MDSTDARPAWVVDLPEKRSVECVIVFHAGHVIREPVLLAIADANGIPTRSLRVAGGRKVT